MKNLNIIQTIYTKTISNIKVIRINIILLLIIIIFDSFGKILEIIK